MKPNRRPWQIIILLIILTFSLDSGLKLIIGNIRIHLGILTILLLSILAALIAPKKILLTLVNDKLIVFAIGFLSLHALFSRDIGNFLFLSSYFAISIALYLFISINIKNIDPFETAKLSIFLILLTGAIQYFLSNILNYQLIFGGIDISYYMANPQFEKRMRGFFLEPNWFGLALLLWSCVLIYQPHNNKEKSTAIKILALSLAAQYLTGNRITLILQLHLLLSVFVKTRHIKIRALIFNPIILSTISGLIFFTANYLFGIAAIESDRSAIARIATLSNVLQFFARHDYSGIFAGYGFSNWGAYSNEYLLSFSNYLGEQELSRRDNSEIYVVLFETGIIGLLLFFLDLKRGWGIEKRKRPNTLPTYSLALSYFFVCSLFYPTYTFAMYCIPLIILRSMNYQAKPAHPTPFINSFDSKNTCKK